MCEGPLKSVCDLDAIVLKLQKKNAGLAELYRVYAFTRSLPRLVGTLQNLLDSSSGEITEILRVRYLNQASSFVEKFRKYQGLVEHVIDQTRLPDLEVNSKHDPELSELRDETENMEIEIENLLDDARSNWASFTDVKIERNGHQGIVFRTTKADDERQLRSNNKQVQVLSIQKVRRCSTVLELCF